MKKIKYNFIITILLLIAFIAFTCVIKVVDVQAEGIAHTNIGLATINKYMFGFFGVNMLAYNITEWLGAAAIFVALYFVMVGLLQLILRGSLKNVDKSIIVLGGIYILMAVIYVFFENWVINYRPIIVDGEIAASYPSSHTMIVFVIMSTTMLQFSALCKNKFIKRLFSITAIFIIIIVIIGRLISGVHWFSDIIGGLLISATLTMLYYSIVKAIE